MPRKKILAGSIKETTVTQMQSLGVYKKEYDPIIDIYCQLREQYSRLTMQYVSDGYSYEVETAQGGKKKSPLVLTLECLRKDILAYSDRLCLNPKAIESVTIDTKPKSALASVMMELRDGR